MDDSHEMLQLHTFVSFFREEGAAGALTVDLGNTITTIALSANQRFLAAGGINCVVNVFELGSRASVCSIKFKKQVGAVALSSDGRQMGVGCFGGVVQWLDVASGDVEFEWDHRKDIKSLAVNTHDTELVAGGDDCAVTIYSLRSCTGLSAGSGFSLTPKATRR